MGSVDLVDLDAHVPPSFQVAQPILPNSHLPKRIQSDSGTGMIKIIVNPGHVSDHHPYL